MSAVIADETGRRLPASPRSSSRVLAAKFAAIDLRVAALKAEIIARTRSDAVARRLATIRGIGPIMASQIAATLPDPSIFRSGRDFAAWVWLVPRQNSTGHLQARQWHSPALARRRCRGCNLPLENPGERSLALPAPRPPDSMRLPPSRPALPPALAFGQS